MDECTKSSEDSKPNLVTVVVETVSLSLSSLSLPSCLSLSLLPVCLSLSRVLQLLYVLAAEERPARTHFKYWRNTKDTLFIAQYDC